MDLSFLKLCKNFSWRWGWNVNVMNKNHGPCTHWNNIVFLSSSLIKMMDCNVTLKCHLTVSCVMHILTWTLTRQYWYYFFQYKEDIVSKTQSKSHRQSHVPETRNGTSVHLFTQWKKSMVHLHNKNDIHTIFYIHKIHFYDQLKWIFAFISDILYLQQLLEQVHWSQLNIQWTKSVKNFPKCKDTGHSLLSGKVIFRWDLLFFEVSGCNQQCLIKN